MSDQKLVKLKWNNTEISAPENSNLLKAALDNGIEVAHYCYHPGLSVAGVCRMCNVEQEGVPRPYLSCNATVKEGMNVTNTTPKIKEMVEWALQMHLVNHPLDCPICDQAGECGLQDYYMKYGGYDSSMVDQKVHKIKVKDIGRNVMLDAERCILCSRCVRFTSEVTGTHELGILNRGDHAEITVNENLNNDYAQNLVDICPVGALTSTDFRFKQRVWYLQNVETTCIGCETGCSVRVDYNKTGAYRVKPVYDSTVNSYWMCDHGRNTYKHVSSVDRVLEPLKNKDGMFLETTVQDVLGTLKNKKLKFIFNTQMTNEELSGYLKFAGKSAQDFTFYQLQNGSGPAFDGILKRSNQNININGLTDVLTKANLAQTLQAGHLDEFIKNLKSDDVVVVVVPEFNLKEDHFSTLLQKIKNVKTKVGLTTNNSFDCLTKFDYLLPAPTFLEKEGTLFNYNKTARKLHKGKMFIKEDYNLSSYLQLLG